KVGIKMVGDRIRSVREKKNVREEEMGKKIGIWRGTYGHYEINKGGGDYETVIKIGDVLNV
ncbi:helix-turn-helix domain-containing protein, partial [Bacillus sp. WP8]|uniref:helix-turn-helix domain-containing protein n=1 Tax=Bacillus sp. WP8 TaxID=756828 RepID=UPI00119E4F24